MTGFEAIKRLHFMYSKLLKTVEDSQDEIAQEEFSQFLLRKKRKLGTR